MKKIRLTNRTAFLILGGIFSCFVSNSFAFQKNSNIREEIEIMRKYSPKIKSGKKSFKKYRGEDTNKIGLEFELIPFEMKIYTVTIKKIKPFNVEESYSYYPHSQELSIAGGTLSSYELDYDFMKIMNNGTLLEIRADASNIKGTDSQSHNFNTINLKASIPLNNIEINTNLNYTFREDGYSSSLKTHTIDNKDISVPKTNSQLGDFYVEVNNILFSKKIRYSVDAQYKFVKSEMEQSNLGGNFRFSYLTNNLIYSIYSKYENSTFGLNNSQHSILEFFPNAQYNWGKHYAKIGVKLFFTQSNVNSVNRTAPYIALGTKLSPKTDLNFEYSNGFDLFDLSSFVNSNIPISELLVSQIQEVKNKLRVRFEYYDKNHFSAEIKHQTLDNFTNVNFIERVKENYESYWANIQTFKNKISVTEIKINFKKNFSENFYLSTKLHYRSYSSGDSTVWLNPVLDTKIYFIYDSPKKFYLHFGPELIDRKKTLVNNKTTSLNVSILLNLKTKYFINEKFSVFTTLNNLFNLETFYFPYYRNIGFNIQIGGSLRF